MDNISAVLAQLGLDQKEKEVYITCLKYTQINASSLSRLTQQPRTTVYGIIERLQKKSLLKSQQTTKWTTFSAVWAEEILIMLAKQQEDLSKNIKLLEEHKEEFQMMGISQFKNLPAVNYYEGTDAVYMVYNNYTKAKNPMALFDIDSAITFLNFTIEELVNIPGEGTGNTKEILLSSENAKKYKKLLHSKKNQVKLLDTDSSKMHSDTIITDDTYYHIAYSERPIIIEIRNDIFLQTQKLFFMELWNRLK